MGGRHEECRMENDEFRRSPAHGWKAPHNTAVGLSTTAPALGDQRPWRDMHGPQPPVEMAG